MAQRQLNLLDATFLVMGAIVGVGIFYNPARVAATVPEPSSFLLIWGVGGLIALMGALTCAELGGALPKAGGWYVFLREAFGPFVAFVYAWVVLGVISTGAVAVMMSICTDNLAALVPAIGAARSPSNLAVGALVIVLVTAVTMLGAKTGATFQNACMVIKLAAIAAMVGGGFLFFAPSAETSVVHTPMPAGGLLSGMISALLPVLFATGGWQMVCFVAPQVRDPQRTLPRAILLGVGCVVVVYLSINAAYLRVLGIDGLAGHDRFAQTMAASTLGAVGGKILQGAMAVSALGVCIVTIMTTPWMYVAMAREGLFFARFERLSPRTQAPVQALVVQAVLCLAYWFYGNAGELVDAVVFVEWIFHALIAVALLRLRATRPDLARPFRSPLYPLAPILYLVFAIVIVFGNLHTNGPHDTVIRLVVLALGALVYSPWRWLVRAA